MNKIKVTQGENIQWVDESYGIRANEEFFNDTLLPVPDLIKSRANTIFRELECLITTRFKSFVFSPVNKYSSLNIEKTDKKALLIFFHGLNGEPSVWNNHIMKFENLAKSFPEFNVDLFTPDVPKKGHCTLDDSKLVFLYEKIGAWTKKNPGKPVILFGQSNGSRIALYAETWLRERAPRTPVHLSLTASVLFGTSHIQSLKDNISLENLDTLTLGLLTPIACQELALGSSSSKNLLHRVRLPLGDNVAERYYRKYCALHDSHVNERGSSLPIFNVNGRQKNKKEKDYLIPGYGHNSLLNSVTDEQVLKAFHWINKKNNIQNSKSRYQV
jgi:hypothetical protein